MNATQLQEELRRALRERIKLKKLTGLGLAKQTGFEQAYISNFLNRKRSLSLEGMDRILAAQDLSIYDLLNREELNSRASSIAAVEGDFDSVVLTDPEMAAMQAVIVRDAVRDMLKFKKSFLRRLRPAASPKRQEWQRFVLIKVDSQEAASMYPRLLPGATVLIDRHYNSLKPYRKGEFNMYAIAKAGECSVKYVEQAGNQLVLRPHNPTYPIESVTIEDGKSAADYLVGRVCFVGIET